ncbi:DUF3822 family protein [Mesonia sp.]|uniref:DUF3822 family protein n=1 Tax=Mesonia sp. TaxID=1960830 RepID=UPI0025B84053|nr:DUF3822 family protein [Mesonia sp.]
MVTTTNSLQHKDLKLSILISQDGLSFCTLNQKENTVEYFYSKDFIDSLDPEKILDELKIAFKFHLEENIEVRIKDVDVLFANNLYSLVPQVYFSEDQLTDYLKFNTKILKTDFIAFDELTKLSANNVYIPYTNINNYLFEKFGTFNYKHSSTLFIDLCLDQAEKIDASEIVFIHLQTKRFDICCVRDKQLILANSFEYYTSQDFIYFVLFTLEQLKFNTEELQLLVSGNVSEIDDTYQYLYTYIKNISFLNTSFLTEKISNLSQKVINPKHNLFLLSNLL